MEISLDDGGRGTIWDSLWKCALEGGVAWPRFFVLGIGLFTPAYLLVLERWMRRKTFQTTESHLPLPPPLEARGFGHRVHLLFLWVVPPMEAEPSGRGSFVQGEGVAVG